jgi:hypothetical protein
MLQLNKQDKPVAAAATDAPNSAPDGAGNPPAGTEFNFHKCFSYNRKRFQKNPLLKRVLDEMYFTAI